MTWSVGFPLHSKPTCQVSCAQARTFFQTLVLQFGIEVFETCCAVAGSDSDGSDAPATEAADEDSKTVAASAADAPNRIIQIRFRRPGMVSVRWRVLTEMVGLMTAVQRLPRRSAFTISSAAWQGRMRNR